MTGWQISRDRLMSALEVLELIPSRVGVASSDFFRIQNLGEGKTRWTVAADATASVVVTGIGEWPIPNKGYWFLNRKTFVPFALAAKEIKNKNAFTVTLLGKTLVIKHGRRKAMFVTQPAVEGYGAALNGNRLNRLEMSDYVRGLVHCARDCASVDQLVPHLNCVYVSPGKAGANVMATNQQVLFRAKSKEGLATKDSVPLPLFLVTLLGARNLKAVEWQDGLVVLKFPNGKVWQSISSKAKLFPKQEVMTYVLAGAKKPLLFRVSTRKLALALQRLGLYLQAASKQDWVLRIKGIKGETNLELSSEIAHSQFRERVSVDGEIQENLELDWPLQMLIPVMDYVGQAHKKLWMEVRVWETKTKSGKKTRASYVRTGDVQLVIPTKA